MITQDIKNPRVNGLGGVLLILGIVGVIFLALLLGAILKPWIGALAATILPWAVGILIAAYITRRYVTEFRYSADARRLRVERLYGDRARFMLEFALNSIVKTGTPEEMKAAYPDARHDNACLKDAPLPVAAVAYKFDGAIRILLFQPDERIRKRLGMKD